MFVYLHVCIVNSQAVFFLAWDGEGEVCKDGSLQVKKERHYIFCKFKGCK
jgi:hypothetical protein